VLQIHVRRCGINARLQDSNAASDSVTALVGTFMPSILPTCYCEFGCLDNSGIEIEIEVKMYIEQLRSGSFQKEMVEVEMKLSEFQNYFIKCAQKFLGHHFNDAIIGASE
jgi:hypothetical protein